MKIYVLAVLCVAALARAQIPSLGFCPEYLPMTGFDMSRFAGIWYEAERYFQLSEVASRCVKSNYTQGPDGKFRVLNEVTSIFTGIKRVVEGEIRKAPSKAEEGRLHVKYTSVPLIPLETQYNVLETDYKNYAVLWSCSGVGPVNTQNAWIMTRQRVAPGEILQRAYAVLDKYKISKLFFMKTNQEDCAYLDSLDAEQNIRPQADQPQKTSAESSEEDDELPKPLKAAEVAPETGAVKDNQVVSAVKNAAAAVKKAANAIREAAIKKPVENAAEKPVAVKEVPAEAVKEAPVEVQPVEQVKAVPEQVVIERSASENVEAVQPVAKIAEKPVEVAEPVPVVKQAVVQEPVEEQPKAVPIVEEVVPVGSVDKVVPKHF